MKDPEQNMLDRDFISDNFLPHDDFTNEADLYEQVEHDGIINNVRYRVSTGCVISNNSANNDVLEIEFVDE